MIVCMKPGLLLCGLLLCPAPAVAGDAAAIGTPVIGTPVIGAPEIVRPAAPPEGAVVLFSGAGGWGDPERSLARALAGRGMAVIGVDLPSSLARLGARTDECVTVIGEIEEVSHRVQRELGAASYRFPILSGIGAGGGMALAVGAQAAAATIGGVTVVDPAAAIPTPKPLCADAPHQETAEGAVHGLPAGATPFPVDILLTAAADERGRAHAAALAGGRRNVAVADTALSPADALLERLGRPAEAGSDSLADLPLIELPVSGPSDRFAILYSGDGGWRDLDKDVAAILQKDGLPVVGVDALRYFWKERTPEDSARDLSRIIDAYRRTWQAGRVLLIGFSFGADILPPVFNRLPAADRAAVDQITLLGLSADADFEVTVAGWLGVGSGHSLPTLPEIGRIDPGLIQCVYGEEDEDAACAALDGSGAEVVRTAGGHHFDGDYPALARRILDGPARRSPGHRPP